MAMACLRLLTVLPLRLLVSMPLLRFLIARFTYLEAPFEYLRAILLLLKQAIMAVVQSAIGHTLVTVVRGTLFPIQHRTVRQGTNL